MSTQLINRTERLATIEDMLFRAKQGVRVVEIAETCGVDRRTVYRDLSLLSEFGLPVYQKDGRYYLNHEYYVATVRLNINELVALYIAARGQTYFMDQENPHVVSALKKLTKTLPDPLARHVKYVIEKMRSGPVDRAFVSVLETMTRAWAEHRKVKLWYRRPGHTSISVREFATYFIEPSSNGGLYAVGYDYLSQHVGAVRLQWVKRVQLLPMTYEIPAQLEQRRYMAGAWGMMRTGIDIQSVNVVMAFSPDVVPAVKEKLRETIHAFKMTENNRCLVSVQVSDWRDILPWIRAWGPKVEVLEPEVLRAEIAAEALKLAAVYGGAATQT
jgi:predicted DNA-binding transcriptional regulator YafY